MVRILILFTVFFSAMPYACTVEQCKTLHQAKESFACYGESLIDYDYRNETFGLGITVGKWVK